MVLCLDCKCKGFVSVSNRVAQKSLGTRMFSNRKAVNNDNLVVFVRQCANVPESCRGIGNVRGRWKTLNISYSKLKYSVV